MRVYFAPCGIGLGHISRCIPIAKSLQSRGHEVLVSTYGEAVKYSKLEGLFTLEVPGIVYATKPDGTIDLKGTAAHGHKAFNHFTRQVASELFLMEYFKPNIVISDSRSSTILASRILRLPRILIINQLLIILPRLKPMGSLIKKGKTLLERIGLEFVSSIWKQSNIILIPDFPPPYTISKENLVVSKRYEGWIRLIGPIIKRRPEELPSKEFLRRRLGFDDRPLILITPSGTIIERQYLVQTLKKIVNNLPKDYIYIISRGLPSSSSINNNGNIIVFDWIEDFSIYLKCCDMVISHGGHTTIAEAMYYGAPMILIPTRGHTEREGNARSAEKLGIAKVIPQINLNKETLLSAIEDILNNDEVRKRAKEVSRTVSAFDAVKEATSIITELMEKKYF